MTRQVNRRSFILIALAIVTALVVTGAMLAHHDAPPAAAVGENSVTFPDPATQDDTGAQSSMKLDANGFPVVAYKVLGAGFGSQIRLLHCNDVNCAGGDESIETPFQSPFGALSPSLSLDSAGNPIITFVLFGVYVLHCNDANCDGGDESLVTFGSCCPSEARHVLAPGDLPVVFFRDNGMQMLRCANTNCTSLTNDRTLLIQPANTYAYSFALDGSGFPVVGYIGNNTASGGDLMLMHCNDLNCDPAVNGAESNLLVDDSTIGGRKVFSHVALALVGGNPVVAYSHYDMSVLKVARCNDANCAPGGDTIEPLNTNTGAHSPGLAIDGNGFPAVSYYDGFGQTFVLHCNDASCSGGNESNHLVLLHGSNSPTVSSPPSLALDGDGIPVASMYHSNGNDLAVLHCGDVNCSVTAPPTPTNTPPATNTAAPTSTHTPTNTPVATTATFTATPGALGRIVFTTDRDTQLQFDLFVMDADGADPTCVTNTVDPVQSYRPDWSPDGSKAVFTRSRGGLNDRELFLVDADGSNLVNLTDNAFYDDTAVWSPDGTKIAFSSNRNGEDYDIFVMDADGSNVVNLTNGADGDFIDEFPAWSPDGTKIAFTAYRDVFTLGAEIYVMDADGANPTRLSNNVSSDTHANWSPDGTKIAFASTRNGTHDVYVMDADDGGNQTRLTNAVLDDFVPKFSPDGTQIAFVTNRDNNWEIYVMDAEDGSNQINITNSPGSTDTQPAWVGATPIDPNCPAPEPTATPTATSTPAPTDTPTNTPIAPTATNTPNAPTATVTPTHTHTNTPVPPTATLTPTHTPTNTPVPSTATFTPTNTPTNTPAPPTATFTSTHTPTSTAVQPTATFTATNTSVPPTATFTPTNTATNTPVPPTATFTSTHTPTSTAVPATATLTQTPTNTPVNTATNTAVPPTATNTASPTATPVGDRCADLNGDGRVNVGDMLRIAVQIFRPYSAQHDINRDGVVNIADLFAAARQFGARRC